MKKSKFEKLSEELKQEFLNRNGKIEPDGDYKVPPESFSSKYRFGKEGRRSFERREKQKKDTAKNLKKNGWKPKGSKCFKKVKTAPHDCGFL